MLDGEIVCLDRHGKTQFRDLLFRRGEPRFYASQSRASDCSGFVCQGVRGGSMLLLAT